MKNLNTQIVVIIAAVMTCLLVTVVARIDRQLLQHTYFALILLIGKSLWMAVFYSVICPVRQMNEAIMCIAQGSQL